MERTERNIDYCWDSEKEEFDWEEYQYLCDMGDYWDCEE